MVETPRRKWLRSWTSVNPCSIFLRHLSPMRWIIVSVGRSYLQANAAKWSYFFKMRRQTVLVVCKKYNQFAYHCPCFHIAQAPSVENLMDFMDSKAPYDISNGTVTPSVPMRSDEFWELYRDDPIYPFGVCYSSLPAGTAALERLFSGAAFLGNGRSALSGKHLHEETYMRHNGRLLGEGNI
jgi:hypothetical protein